jgi:hypothetical protein
MFGPTMGKPKVSAVVDDKGCGQRFITVKLLLGFG